MKKEAVGEVPEGFPSILTFFYEKSPRSICLLPPNTHVHRVYFHWLQLLILEWDKKIDYNEISSSIVDKYETQKTSYQAEALTAMEAWLIACIVFVFACLIEWEIFRV